MLEYGAQAKAFKLEQLGGGERSLSAGTSDKPMVLAFFSTECPTCQLTLPYLERLAGLIRPGGGEVIGVSQDDAEITQRLLDQAGCTFPVLLDEGLEVSRAFDPQSVPTVVVIDKDFCVGRTEVGFSKEGLNALGAEVSLALGIEPVVIAPDHDGAPARKPGCESKHLEPEIDEAVPDAPRAIYAKRGPRATRTEVADIDPYDYCVAQGFSDPLPIVPPTAERVDAMLAATDLPPDEVIGLVAPNYAMATVEKIAANAVMAGCEPKIMRALIPLIRAVCDEKFNIHGVQATTHFAAPLVIMHGPIRNELDFHCRGNVMSNVARSNSTLGRAFQLILTNLGGAKPAEIDMSTLGNAAKFSSVIGENNEQSPWDPMHTDYGFDADQSALTLFACEPPRGVSEHKAREGRTILMAISHALRTIWTTRSCMMAEALVIICPEHAKTLAATGFTRTDVRDFLFENTGVPMRGFDNDDAEGSLFADMLTEITVDGEKLYRKFREPESLKVMVAGGTAGKFSAVLGSWLAGPRGSQAVTYPID